MGTNQITNTESLEDVLERVECLSGDLSSNLKEEKWHWESPHEVGEEVYEKGGFYKGSSPWTEEEYERTKERIVDEPAVPNTQKREAARTGLQQIYDSSEWYSGRYAAGKALGLSVKDKLDEWLKNLEVLLKSVEVEQVSVYRDEKVEVFDPKNPEHQHSRAGDFHIEEVFDHYEDKEVPDIIKRSNAVKDAGELFKLSRSQKLRGFLERIYDNNDSKDLRILAGKRLGYNSLTLLIDEHPIAAALTGVVAASAVVVAASAVFGLGYLLSQYMAR